MEHNDWFGDQVCGYRIRPFFKWRAEGEWYADERPISGWNMAYSTIKTGPPTAVSHKTQGHSKRIFHLFLGLRAVGGGGALVSLNWLMDSNLKTSLDFITPPMCFSRNSLFFMLQLMLLRRETYNVTSSFDHIPFSGQIIPISWFLFKSLWLRFCSFIKFLTPTRFVFAEFKAHLLNIWNSERDTG